MKKIFYLSLLLFCKVILFAQTPGGIAGSVLWLKGNAGASPGAWNDNSGSSNNFLQSNPANQPVLSANVFNFNSALLFDGANSVMSLPAPIGFPENSDDRTIFVVAKTSSTTGYQWIFVYGTPNTVGATFQAGTYNAGLANAFFGSTSDLTYPNYWNADANINGALASFTMTSGTGDQYDRGNLLQSNFLGALTATSVNGVIGALSTTPIKELWAGSIGEIILFNSSLSTANRNQVEAYLALKYGFTLGDTGTPISYVASDGTTTYWTASTIYQNDVFGIGTDNGTALVQTQSNSMNSGNGDGTGQSIKGNIVLSTGSALADKQFLMIGNDAGALAEQTIAPGEAPVVAEGSQRLVRNWKVQNTGSVGAVDLSFDITDLGLTGGTTASNYRLMIDDDGDGDYFTTGTQTFVKPVSFTGNQLNFSGVTLPNNAVFTIITQASALLPAIWQDFTVALQKNKATLTWKTSNEINVDHYTAEYSVNGVGFIPVGTVAAKNSAGINTYTLTQENLPAGIRYYRIRRVDKDGKSELSQVKSVRVDGLTTVVLKSNPLVKGRLELNIDVPQNQEAVIRVVNTAGKVLTQQYTGLSAGTNAIAINVSHIAAGTYFVQVQLANEIINKKIVKL